ncbi:hypothetical protein Thiowin_01492 [Thiorhodovibrio winogradskyi]|uniref:Restriction endonuclease subunit S n=1 Tax=Thiorhodovibrio winogradskyi TaxID=77007 RepID=A0ABZ0S6G4_9GAMM|nr:hypothetical protein [Thiorhodovibrio winogradskyi]
MFATRVATTNLNERLDAGFYHPEYLSLDDRLDSFGAVSLYTLVKGVSCGPFGGNAIADDLYAEEGVIFVRPLNITSNTFDDASVVKVPKELLKKYGLKVYSGKNLYFGRVGMPCVSVINAETSISPNIIIARLDSAKADPDYLYAFSSSRYGLSQLKRQLKEVAQPTTSTDAVKYLKVFLPCREVQKYIGDKIRQAEMLFAWSRNRKAKVASTLPVVNQETDVIIKEACFVSTKILTESRLDGWFYQSSYLKLEELLRKVGYVKLGDLCKRVNAGWKKSDSYFYYYEIGGINVSTGTIDADLIRACDAPTRAKTTIRFGDVVVSTVRPNRKNVALIIDDHSPLDMVATSGFSVLRFRSNEEAALYGLWLRSDDATMQLMRWNSGSAYPAIDDEVPLHILAPTFDSKFVEMMGAKILDAHFALRIANKLSKSASFLVEALIEGNVTESQFIATQKALEFGDTSQDRAILSRLKTEGMDGKGDPLFPDLDRLYELLEQANH